MSIMEPVNLYAGTLVDCPVMGELRARQGTLLGVSMATGTILAVMQVPQGKSPEQAWQDSHPQSPIHATLHLKPGQFLVPGLIDTHIHAPQYVFTGTGYDLPLLKWLEKYTFPREAEFADVAHAKRVYEAVVRRTLRAGTTSACYYATIHLAASRVLADTVLRLGQRAFVGKVNMVGGLRALARDAISLTLYHRAINLAK
jgi:cytosine/adenosine deaminase-related metal-dependent hydrolase